MMSGGRVDAICCVNRERDYIGKCGIWTSRYYLTATIHDDRANGSHWHDHRWAFPSKTLWHPHFRVHAAALARKAAPRKGWSPYGGDNKDWLRLCRPARSEGCAQ